MTSPDDVTPAAPPVKPEWNAEWDNPETRDPDALYRYTCALFAYNEYLEERAAEYEKNLEHFQTCEWLSNWLQILADFMGQILLRQHQTVSSFERTAWAILDRHLDVFSGAEGAIARWLKRAAQVSRRSASPADLANIKSALQKLNAVYQERISS